MLRRMTPTTPTRTFRFTVKQLADLDELAKRLGANRSEAVQMAIHIARERLGLVKQDAVAAMADLARQYGDDARLVATVTQLEGGEAVATINGERLDGWTAGLSVATAGFTSAPHPKPAVVGSMMVRHDATGTYFGLGQQSDPEAGTEFACSVGDLADLAVLRTPEGKSPADARRDVKNELRLRRSLRAAMGATDFDVNDNEEELPLDDDID